MIRYRRPSQYLLEKESNIRSGTICPRSRHTDILVVLPVALLKAVVCLVLVVVGHGQWLCSFALALSVATVLWLLLVRRQLTFAACMLETASNCLTQFPGSLGMAAVILVLGTAYVVLWGLSFSMRSQMSPGWGAIWIVCCVLMLHWTAEVLRNVVHLTVGGAVAAWYFSEGQAPPSPTPRSLRQSLSTSFGSVCCGSLLPSLAIPVHSALLSLQSATDSMRNCGMLALLLHRLLHSFTPLMQRFNLYAFAHVALYGKPYFQAARDTWTLTMTCGLVRVFNDSLVGTVPTLLSLLAGIFLGGLVELITRSWFISLLCTVEGVIVAGVVFTTCSSAATTLCVCFAEKPSNLQAVDVSLYSQIIEATAESAAAGLVPRTPLR
eukprot:GGOE01000489.1.p2 GENE.GGOE01000489.1~~GGOE01000489.1.p2  ORF type:complete len:380 (-),score=109.63 GGOE01000489.1:256-1395(-)